MDALESHTTDRHAILYGRSGSVRSMPVIKMSLLLLTIIVSSRLSSCREFHYIITVLMVVINNCYFQLAISDILLVGADLSRLPLCHSQKISPLVLG